MRSTALALILMLSGAAVAPVVAADNDAARVVDREITANSGTAALGADVDWSLSPLEIGRVERGRLLPALYVSFAGLQAFDAYSTTLGLSRGAREANPLMGGATSRTATMFGVKAGVAVASIYTAERLWKQHRRAQAIGVMLASNAIMAAVAVHNASVVRDLR